MEITSFAPNNFAPKKFFGGAKYPSKISMNVDFDCIMKAFFDERNKLFFFFFFFFLLHTLFIFIFLDLFTERACPQLAKANLGGPCPNKKITKKIYRQKSINEKKKYSIK